MKEVVVGGVALVVLTAFVGFMVGMLIGSYLGSPLAGEGPLLNNIMLGIALGCVLGAAWYLFYIGGREAYQHSLEEKKTRATR